MKEMTLSEKMKFYRINETELALIRRQLGREPQGLEWALYSALWSEHCSYKSSKIYLRQFAKTMNHRVQVGEGENAGVLDLGFGERLVFKMESHNHPSFIEPYQGAATGVGGILRDIFTMGARPIALANYLCFGDVTAPRMPTLIDGVVRGIGGYGNCVGVPTVTGQTNFHPSYNQNILVNAMAVGLLTEGEQLALSAAQGVGNWVIAVGAATGRDGVHGAAMASESFDDDSESKRPNVQMGDPYFEKLLIEACLKVIHQKLVVAIQDMGAAGLTSSSFEMAAKGQVGLDIHLDQVPLRDSTMGPEEILLSESQERMLLIAEPGKVAELKKVFEHFGLHMQKIGVVTSGPAVRLFWHGECVTEIDPKLLVDEAPRFERPRVDIQEKIKVTPLTGLEHAGALLDLNKQLSAPAHCSRRWIHRQFDQRVGLRTLRGAEHDVAFVRLPSGRAVAMTCGFRPWVGEFSARLGALDALLYPSLQMAIKGALPVGATDCLNFGNPEKPEIMGEFAASTAALTEMACLLDTPIISGNVSFYNETKGQNIISTPATGVIGLVENGDRLPPEDHFAEMDSVVVVASEACLRRRQSKDFAVGTTDFSSWAKRVKGLAELVLKLQPRSSQMSSQGGLLTSVAKMVSPQVGLRIDPTWTLEELTDEVFYEVIFEVPEKQLSEWQGALQKLGCVVRALGVTDRSGQLQWKNHNWQANEMIAARAVGWKGVLGEKLA